MKICLKKNEFYGNQFSSFRALPERYYEFEIKTPSNSDTNHIIFPVSIDFIVTLIIFNDKLFTIYIIFNSRWPTLLLSLNHRL